MIKEEACDLFGQQYSRPKSWIHATENGIVW